MQANSESQAEMKMEKDKSGSYQEFNVRYFGSDGHSP
jgi:hypothetical protein